MSDPVVVYVEVPVLPIAPGTALPRSVNAKALSPAGRRGLKLLTDGMEERAIAGEDGRAVTCKAQAVRVLLERIAAAYDAAAQAADGRMP